MRARLAFQPLCEGDSGSLDRLAPGPGRLSAWWAFASPVRCPRRMRPALASPPLRRAGRPTVHPATSPPTPPAVTPLRCPAHAAAGTTPTGSPAPRCRTPPCARPGHPPAPRQSAPITGRPGKSARRRSGSTRNGPPLQTAAPGCRPRRPRPARTPATRSRTPSFSSCPNQFLATCGPGRCPGEEGQFDLRHRGSIQHGQPIAKRPAGCLRRTAKGAGCHNPYPPNAAGWRICVSPVLGADADVRCRASLSRGPMSRGGGQPRASTCRQKVSTCLLNRSGASWKGWWASSARISNLAWGMLSATMRP